MRKKRWSHFFWFILMRKLHSSMLTMKMTFLISVLSISVWHRIPFKGTNIFFIRLIVRDGCYHYIFQGLPGKDGLRGPPGERGEQVSRAVYSDMLCFKYEVSFAYVLHRAGKSTRVPGCRSCYATIRIVNRYPATRHLKHVLETQMPPHRVTCRHI